MARNEKQSMALSMLMLFVFVSVATMVATAQADGGEPCSCCVLYCNDGSGQIAVEGHIHSSLGTCYGAIDDGGCGPATYIVCPHHTYRCPGPSED